MDQLLSASTAASPLANPTLLTRDAVLAADDIRSEDVDVPEWGGVVRVKSLTGAERDDFVKKLGEAGEKANFNASLLVATVVDQAGQRLFNVADLPVLTSKSAQALERVVRVACRLNGIGQST